MFEDDLNRALFLIKSGNKFEAREILKQIVQDDPQNEKVRACLADTYPDIPNRIAVFQECLRYKPDNLIARKWLATVKQAEVFVFLGVVIIFGLTPDKFHNEFSSVTVRLVQKAPGL